MFCRAASYASQSAISGSEGNVAPTARRMGDDNFVGMTILRRGRTSLTMYGTFSRVMVASMFRELFVAYPIHSDAMRRCDHTRRRVKANLLDDGIGDTLVSVG